MLRERESLCRRQKKKPTDGSSHLCLCQILKAQYLPKCLNWIGCCLYQNKRLCWLFKDKRFDKHLTLSVGARTSLCSGATVCFLSGVGGSESEHRGSQVSQLSPSSVGLHIHFLEKVFVPHADIKHARTLSGDKRVLQIKVLVHHI